MIKYLIRYNKLIFVILLLGVTSVYYFSRHERIIIPDSVDKIIISVDGTYLNSKKSFSSLVEAISYEYGGEHDNVIVFGSSIREYAGKNVFIADDRDDFFRNLNPSVANLQNIDANAFLDETYQKFASLVPSIPYTVYLFVEESAEHNLKTIQINGVNYPTTYMGNSQYKTEKVRSKNTIVAVKARGEATIIDAFFITDKAAIASDSKLGRVENLSPKKIGQDFDLVLADGSYAIITLPSGTGLRGVDSEDRISQPQQFTYFEIGSHGITSYFDATRSHNAFLARRSGQYEYYIQAATDTKYRILLLFVTLILLFYMMYSSGITSKTPLLGKSSAVNKLCKDITAYLAEHSLGLTLTLGLALFFLLLRTSLTGSKYISSFMVLLTAIFPFLIYTKFSIKVLGGLCLILLCVDVVLTYVPLGSFQEKTTFTIFVILFLVVLRLIWDQWSAKHATNCSLINQDSSRSG